MCDSDNSEDQSDQPCAKKVKLHYGILPSHHSQQSSQGSQNIIIETGQLNTRHTINVVVNNSKRERQKQYRERNRDKLKHREAERRKRIQSSQSIIGPSTSSNSNIMELNNEEPVTAISSSLQNKRDRQKRYREKNREKLSQREAERRRRIQNAESIIELYTSPNIENREIITEPIIIIDEVSTNSRNLTGLGEMEHEVFDISQQNLSNLSSTNIAEIPNNYSQFRYHKTAHEYFIDNFKNNEFGHACSICDRLWFEKDLKKPSTSGNCGHLILISNFYIKSLKSHDLIPDDINYVVSTHGHSDHIGNNNLFLKAKHIVGFSISYKDKYYIFPFDKGEEYVISDTVKVIPTPGHTLSDVTVLVKSNKSELVAIAGDLFEKYEDIEDPNIWLEAGSEDKVQQARNRSKIADTADWIIPGHGAKFQVTEELRKTLRKQIK